LQDPLVQLLVMQALLMQPQQFQSQEFAGGMLADKELLNQFRFIEQLPDTDKSVVKVFLDAFITKRQLQTLAL
jgi:hypothetical protein